MANLVQNVRRKMKVAEAGLKRPSLLRRVRARERRNERDDAPLTPEARLAQQARTKRLIPGTRRFISLTRGKGPVGAKYIMAATATWFIITTTAFIWPVQVAFAVVAIGGLGALFILDTEWVGYLDLFGWVSGFGQDMLFISLVIVFIIGFLVMMAAIFIYTIRGISIGRGLSIFVMAICLALYAVPILNLFPWMWFWCVYVVKSQADG